MGRIIAVANQKGGVGKSTTAINLSACLAEKGKKVLAIDMDPQGNTTSGFGVDKNGIENTLYELLLGEAETKDTIVKDVVENLDLIPSNINLSGAEIELVGIDDKEFILKGITDKLRRKYDYIILDCPPSLNMLTINALTAATSVLVPIQCEYYALEGLSQLIHTIDLVKERLNKRLKMEGVVFTMYDARTNLSLQVVENVKENLNQEDDLLLKKISYYHPDSPYALMKFQNDLLHYLKIKHKKNQPLVIVCIGTDRATGDCLGPLVGQALLPSPQYSVFGTLKEPIHAKNLNQTFKEIYSVCQNPFIIAVDSCLGYAQHVGCITLSPLPLLPGRGVSKQLPPIGQLSITGIVNVFSDSVSNESVIQNTRLHTVIKLADFITNGIKSANIPSIYQVSCPHP